MRFLTLISLMGLIISGCQPVLPPKVWQTSITSTPSISAPAKQITLNTLSLVERWRWSGNINNFTISLPEVTLTEDRIVIIEREEADQRIIVFDVHTGDSLWKSKNIWNIHSVAADEEHVYIGTITYVQAFDLETGQALWLGAEQPDTKRGGLTVYSKGDWLEVYDVSEPDYILDPKTGQTIEEISRPSLFFRSKDRDYSIVRGNYLLEAKDVRNDEKLWTYAFPGYIHSWPVFVGDIMLLNAKGQIYGMEIKTGEIIWQTTETQATYTHPEYITGVALQGNLAYALRYDAAIVGFNPETGEQVGIVEMMPNRTLEDDKTEVKHYAIATSDRFVAVYYGNSSELIVFEKIQE